MCWERGGEKENDMRFFSAPLLSQALISIISLFCSTLNIVNLGFFLCLFFFPSPY